MNKEFKVHMLNGSGRSKAHAIALAFDDLLEDLKMYCQENTREFSIVKTKLEEACFFAKKSMAEVPENQEKE
jgi:chloramphenicol 3-O-phosphotransferase